MREALALCQACCSHGDDAARVSEESWAQMALEDVTRGGSVHMQYIKCGKSLSKDVHVSTL